MRRALRFLRSQGPALLALFVALGGTAYASGLPANLIGPKQLKANAVTRPKLAPNAVNGSKVANDALSGADVREATLTGVPSATHVDTAAEAVTAVTASKATSAPNATTAAHVPDTPLLGGQQAAFYERRVEGTCDRGISSIYEIGVNCAVQFAGVASTLTAGAGGFSQGSATVVNLVVYCHDGGKTAVEIRNISPVTGTLNWFYHDGSASHASGTAFAGNAAAGPQFSFAAKRIEGQFIAAANGRVATIRIHAVDFGSGCEFQDSLVAP